MQSPIYLLKPRSEFKNHMHTSLIKNFLDNLNFGANSLFWVYIIVVYLIVRSVEVAWFYLEILPFVIWKELQNVKKKKMPAKNSFDVSFVSFQQILVFGNFLSKKWKNTFSARYWDRCTELIHSWISKRNDHEFEDQGYTRHQGQAEDDGCEYVICNHFVKTWR